MPTVEQKQRWRELILKEVYDRTGGDYLKGVTPPEILEGIYEELGEATGPDVQTQFNYLSSEGLLKRHSQTSFVITHEGVRRVEEQDAEREVAMVLPAVVVRDVEAFLTEVQRKRDDLGLAADDERALDAAVVSAEAQIKSPKPNRGIVRAAIGAIGLLVRDATAGAVGSALYATAAQLLGKL